MRSFCTISLIFGVLVVGSADASVLINVDKTHQRMVVEVDGQPRYEFAVSTGRAGFGTPNGTYYPQRLERTWFSKEYYNSPMPYSIFFNRGFAIHGSYEISHLGGPASHGCIRLHPSNAAKLFSLVQTEGVGSTTIVVSGSTPPTYHEVQEAKAGSRTKGNVPAGQSYSGHGYEDGYGYGQSYPGYPSYPRGWYSSGPLGIN